jgi:hypothetical protein
MMGCRYSWTPDGLQPPRVICGVMLSNHSVKPSLFQGHFNSYYMNARKVK